MAKAAKGSRVRIHFTGTLEDGTVFDTTLETGGCSDDACSDDACSDDACSDDACGCGETGPMDLVLGNGDFFPQVEDALIGMAPGDKKTLTIAFADAFGDYDEERVFSIARSDFPTDLDPEVDQNLELIGDDGEAMIVSVVEVDAESVVLDANHPLAGEDLHFEIELVEIL